ncbi:hypothetical protein [Aquimarina sp. AU58]|uniref:hypothetical protein n=1 Tax=Aquimarina sp. AU58 TaxID=1874112 RepID=UPI000D6E7BE3|nr:hypothetical protein [Aquimarina sp. AU58]
MSNSSMGCLSYGLIFFLVLLGGYLTYLGSNTIIKGIYYEIYGIETRGKIIEYIEIWDEDENTYYYQPIIMYSDIKNISYTIQSKSSSNLKSISTTRRILYLEKNPKDGIEAGFLYMWVFPVIQLFFGMVCLGVLYTISKQIK